MFEANVTQFLNGNPSNLSFQINGLSATPDGKAIDVDIDVAIKHPFPGLHGYDGYDVRGIFIGDGSAVMAYNSNLKYASYGTNDQVMYDYDMAFTPPVFIRQIGNPDGYTRWWNPTEFTSPNMFGYVKGVLASQSYNATATLNPYKYYADGLAVDGDAFKFLSTTSNSGIFTAGSTNTRNYYLRFPSPTPGIKFAYAVVANWKGTTPQDKPANAPEALATSCTITPDIYYVPPGTDKGGNLKLDLSIFDWAANLSAGKMEDYQLIVESTVLLSPWHSTLADMAPTGGGAHYSTYHVEIPADNITTTNGNEFWVIVEDQNNNYKNDYGFSNNCGDDKLAAFSDSTCPSRIIPSVRT